jgi:hypothetical protein
LLPDLPKLKEELFEVQRSFMIDVKRMHLGPIAEFQILPCFEGHRHSILRATGDGEVSDFDHVEGMVEINIKDDLETVFCKLAKTAIDMAGKIVEQSFKTLNDTLALHGRTLDGKGKPWTEQFLEMLSNVQFPLKDDGSLDLDGFRIVNPPPQAARELRELEADPVRKKVFYERYNNILAQKETEARAFEASRNYARCPSIGRLLWFAR